MGAFKDLTGQKFGKLTVLEIAEKRGIYYYYKCNCDCGNEKIVRGVSLTNGAIKSCGCLNHIKPNKDKIKHGLRTSKVYKVWADAKQRCTNPNDTGYKRYGGRGIAMYEAWINDFKAFYDYVSKLPHFGEKGYTLDRIDNNGNYEPNNIRWVTATKQARNRRTNRFVEYNGKVITVADAAEISKLPVQILYNRLKRGDTGERLFRPVKK